MKRNWNERLCDTNRTNYCGKDRVVWPAPVEDLTQWRYDGVIFESPSVTGEGYDTLCAPDIVEVTEKGKKVYYLYLNSIADGRQTMVAKSDSPIGPFEVINWTDGTKTATNGMLWAGQNSILTGSSGKLNPQGDATGAQVASMLMRFISIQ